MLSVFLSIAVLTAILLTACGPTPNEGVIMVEYVSGQIKLAEGEAITNSAGVEFRLDGKVIDPKDIPNDQWVEIVRIDNEGGGFWVTTTTNGITKVKLTKNGGEIVELKIKK